jgi:Conjugal transfer protein
MEGGRWSAMVAPLFIAAILGNPLASHIKASTEELIQVRTKMWMVTEVDFPKGTEIVANGSGRPRYGDPKFWDISTDRNALFIRPQDDPLPMGGGRTTTIIVTLTDGRRFQILASEVSKEKNGRPDYHVIAELEDKDRPEQPEYVRVDTLAGLRTENAVLHKYCETPTRTAPSFSVPTPGLQNNEVDTLNQLRFWDYEIYDVKGKRDFKSVLFHNERFTFVALRGSELPTVSALRDGKFTKVESSWVRNRYEMPFIEEGMVQVGKDSFKFKLKGKG